MQAPPAEVRPALPGVVKAGSRAGGDWCVAASIPRVLQNARGAKNRSPGLCPGGGWHLGWEAPSAAPGLLLETGTVEIPMVIFL